MRVEGFKRRTTHGLVCKCGSDRVRVDATRTEELSRSGAERLLERRQYCHCADCGLRMSRRFRVRETEIGR